MYGKVFSQIFDSSLLADGGWLPTYVFMCMISMADKDGLVEVAPLALYRRVGLSDGEPDISVDDYYRAISYLEEPDPESRTPDHDGRRIIPLSQIDSIPGNRGWLIVNYELYRHRASKSEPRGASTERVRRYRARKDADTKNQELSASGNGDVTIRNGHTDTDVDIDLDGNTTTPATPTVDDWTPRNDDYDVVDDTIPEPDRQAILKSFRDFHRNVGSRNPPDEWSRLYRKHVFVNSHRSENEKGRKHRQYRDMDNDELRKECNRVGISAYGLERSEVIQKLQRGRAA